MRGIELYKKVVWYTNLQGGGLKFYKVVYDSIRAWYIVLQMGGYAYKGGGIQIYNGMVCIQFYKGCVIYNLTRSGYA